MPRTKRFTFLIILLFGIAIFALPALAQVDLGLEYGESLGLTSTDIRITIGRIINAFLGLLGIVAVLLILYAGFLWMTAGGDSQQIDKAKAWMRNGVIGLVIIMSAYAIASFILGAIQRGTLGEGAGGPGGPGGGGIPGSRSVFSVAGVAPIGSGPRNNGWPKNYAIQVAFTADIFPGSVSPASFAVTRCNPRLSGDEPRPFNEADCDVEVVGTRAIESNRIIFRPNASPEEDPTYFEHDYWYRVSVNDGLQDTRGRRLICWPTLGDISSPEADRYLCDRAMAFSNQVDITPPTVSIGSPVSYPAYCSEQIEIRATARDDFLPTLVSFRLNGGAANLVDEFFDPYPGEATVFNSSPVDPFEVFEIQDDIYIDARGLETGVPHTLTAVAADGVPQSGAMTGRKFYINPAHCCNGVIDADQGEEGEDCGGECRGCPGSACTTHEDCASGYCNPDTGRCEDRPIITDVTPLDAGPGSLITISGRFFGSRPGRIVFLGAEGEADDVTVEACDPAAWQHNEVIVAVPAAAVSGPLMLITAAGPADRTDDEFGDPVHDFTVTADVLPGICYLEPSVGSSGSAFNIHGSGFGAAIGDSLVRMDGVDIGRGGMTWAANLITAIVPTVLREGIYPVRVVVGGVRPSNPANFTLRLSSSAGGPRIEEIRPATGPVGSYVTILGSGFGNRRGQVYFLPEVGDDIALGLEPICADNWHDNYIVVKVPRTPGLTQEIIEENEGELFVEEGDYQVQVITSVSGQPSNRVGFEVTDAAVPPGMCSISPVSGPPGTVITVQGEGFGTGPGNVAAMGGAFNPARPENSLRFYLRGVMSDLLPRPDYVSMASGLYPAWGGTSLRAVVPGDRGNPATWPVSGPVHVVAENVWARNPIPFNVQNCNVDNTCAEGTTCCRDGSCHTPDDPCQDERNSAFGWLFSTNVLPNYPRVLRRSCVLGVDHPVRQSPTPADRLTNVCLDAQVAVAFTTEMLPESLRDPASILFEECGNGDSLDCSGGELVPIDRATINIAVEADEAGRRTVIAFRPQAGAYPPDDPADPDDLPGNRQLRPGYWYRVTLRSNPGEGFGIVDMDGRYLDGNFDRRPGGDYSWFFRAKQDRTPCEIAGVFVNPGRATIEHQGVPNTVFEAVPTDGRCVELECVAGGGYRIDWSIDGGHISPAPRPPAHPRAHCVYYASGERETPEGESDRLFCALTPDDGELPLRGVSLVRVAFADPTVTKVSPADGCEEACTNALIYAQFNVPMNEGSLTAPGNVQLFECRNPSCNPPFNLIPFAVVADAPAVPADPARGMMRVTIVPRGRLRPLTHYVVRLKGGDETGITSISLVPLTGLNTAGWYQWSFRTVEDAEGCAIGRVELRPNYATLYYVGQRLGLNLTARSRPNTCDPDGLELVADEYDWEWGINPNPVLRGFVSAAGWPLRVDDTTTVDTDSTLPRGCTDRCLMTGSLPNVPACGNGLPAERGEDCDDGNVLDGDGCSSNCLVSGTEPPACGNGAINVGENCEALPDPLAGGALVFPRGCMDPRQDYNGDGRPEGWGCILLGSTAGRSTCGDRIRADGEACDDGNTRDGDGCSRDCLNEGTVQLCTIATPAGELCVSSCGNGLTEPGEECDDGNTNRGDGCSANCLYEGALVGACPPPVPGDPPPMNCCGNGVVEAGFGEACDDGNASNNDGCSDRCLREGSSAFHDTPSFCGDGVLNAPAEHPRCDGRMLGPDGFTDTYQVVMSRDNDTDDPALATSTVTADHPEVPAGQEGNSRVTLACTCGVAVDGDAHCAAIVDAIRLGELPGPLPDEPLGCAVSGCCVAKPRVLSYDPVAGRDDICRNGIISVFFDQPMDSVSVKQNLKVGYYNADGCGEGVEVVRPIAIAEVGGQPRGLLARLWQHVVGFVQRIISPVFGAPAIPLPAVADFCLVNGQVVTPSATEAEFWPSEPYPADAWLRVRVLPGAKSTHGVTIQSNIAHFGTRDEICRVRRVSVDPESDLFSSIEDEHAFTAEVHSDGDMPIVSMPGIYAWNLSWTEQPDGGDLEDGPVSPIVVEDEIPAEEIFPLTPNQARVRVRGSRRGDRPEDYIAQDGKAVVEAAITITESTLGDLDARYAGRSNVVVMLCNNPWPEWRACSATGEVSLPWEQNDGGGLGPAPIHHCAPNSRVWYPFLDRWTNVEFYYCRDGVRAGDAGGLLPYLNIEDPVGTAPADSGRSIVRLTDPAPGIMREYLFTFDPVRSRDGVWRDDAFGLRIAANRTHSGIADWYVDRGFRGSPSSLSVAGYDGLRDGRTVYVNAGAQSGINLFTNVYVMSYSDGASAETVSVFNQILSRLDFNANLADTYICRLNDGSAAHLEDSEDNIICKIDADCPLGTCDVPESKFKHDVRRWADLQNMRRTINQVASPPALREGTFLRSRTYSIWPSWDAVLGSGLRVNLPKDPLNNIAACPVEAGFEADTCWNSTEREFRCGDHSHIYKYSMLSGGVQLNADLEYLNDAGRAASWQFGGETCLDPVDSESCLARGCKWSGGACNYADTKIWLSGYRGIDSCTGVPLGEGAECGNGILNESDVDPEICEVGQRRVGACNVSAEIEGVLRDVEGTREEICQTEGPRACREFIPVNPDPATCEVGYCGDGVIQGSREERCDDGALNGRYGYCSTNCKTLGFRCGDGLPHPSEVCDCGASNGRYYLNGILAGSGVACAGGAVRGVNVDSCSWDCRGPAPRCGDGIINGTEQCDGGIQTSRGACIGTSGDVRRPNGRACATNADCAEDGGLCVFCPTVDQRFTRSCGANNPASDRDDPTACQWSAWACTAPGRCGNGMRETGEECDDGNIENNDTCTNTCRNNVCGDGFVNWAGGELCDDGARNGTRCTPTYGRLCTYCTPACRIGTVSGPYCGDGDIQGPASIPAGPEICEPVLYTPNSSRLCVSTRLQDQSFGAQTGYAICSDASCVLDCADRESEICEIESGLAVIGGSDNLDCPACRAYVIGSGPAPLERCDTVFDPQLREFCVERQHWLVDETQETRLPDSCDPDDDNDGVPDDFDCVKDNATAHPRYLIPDTGIVVPAGLETSCDGIDNDCNARADDALHLRNRVDMVFVIDVTGTMNNVIDSVINALSDLARQVNAAGTGDHRFGFVTISQKELNTLNIRQGPRYLPHSFQDLVSFAEFETALRNMYSFCWRAWDDDVVRPVCDKDPQTFIDWNRDRPRLSKFDPGRDDMGVEASYAAAYALMRPDNDYGWDYGISWRRNAHPYVVVVTDEPPPAGNGLVPVPESALASVNLEIVAEAARNCTLPGCDTAEDYVELFVLSRGGNRGCSNHRPLWESALPEPINEFDTPRSARFVDICRSINADTLARTIFQKVCGEE